MFDILVTAVNAVFPLILLILLGYALKRLNFFNNGFVKAGNKFIFRICLPCMLFINIYDNMDGFADIRWDVVIYSVTVICLIFALGLLVSVLTTKNKKRRGVILQCTFRSNFAIIGLALVERLGGDGAVAGVVSAFSIPVFNIFAVIALTVFNENETVCALGEDEDLPALRREKRVNGIKKILLGIVKNPLIIGVAAGLVCVAVREIERACVGEVVFRLNKQLKFLYIGLSDLKAIASPLALVVLGGQFEFSAAKGMTKEIIVGTIGRIIAAPLIGIGGAALLSGCTDLFTFGPEIYPSLIALFGTPVAVSSAIMAGEMHSDEQLATQFVVWTSVCSIVTIFFTVFILMACGLLAF